MSSSVAPRIHIVYYSMYGHVRTLALKIAEGVRAAGGEPHLFQISETLPADVLEKMHAPPKSDDPVATPETLTEADGILFGFPTRFGMAAAQVKAFLDTTGGLWMKGALVGKPAGLFFSTGTQGGGQETTALTFVTQLVHHGMVFVPLGYSTPLRLKMDEMVGGSPYGSGTFAGGDGSRTPSETELQIAEHQGSHFTGFVAKLKKGSA
mmetsp:Transcript_24908/g.80225  ORF Transcript_24908/g.80225 Transcript_24908/m.80225 type:complete len:208 (+) Transcript_24908:110-733(+)